MYDSLLESLEAVLLPHLAFEDGFQVEIFNSIFDRTRSLLQSKTFETQMRLKTSF